MPRPSVEAHETWRARYQDAVTRYVFPHLDRAGSRPVDASADVFRARLYALGFRGQGIAAEVAYYDSPTIGFYDKGKLP